jgi:hypothetical protein
MSQNQDAGLPEILLRHAKNLLRITSIPSRKEVEEFRNQIRTKLKGGRIDIRLLLQEIQDEACREAETAEKKDPSLHEYYMAVYAETAFLLSALTTDRWIGPSHRIKTA